MRGFFMINFVIVDDNKLQRKRISNIILNSMMSNKLDFNIQEFDDYSEQLCNFIHNASQDTIYILDLELPSGDGVDIARVIRNDNDNWISPIIIITVHTSMYYEVYKQRLQILDFIAKCDDIEKDLSENIDICLKMINKETTYRYKYKSVDYTININNIDYIQRDGRKTRIITSKEEYSQNISISEIKKKLPPYFVLSSKGVLINMKNVDRIDWSDLKVTFKDKKEGFIVSKSHRKEIDEYELV